MGGRCIFAASFAGCVEVVEPAVGRVLRTLAENGIRNGQLTAVELALREALANAVIHGNCNQSGKRVRVECFQHRDRSLLLVVRDQGSGFDPTGLVDPTKPENIYRDAGRGIFLIRYFMDEVRFARGGREIRMCKDP